MAALNLEKAIEKAYEIMDPRYGLYVPDIQTLVKKDKFDAIEAAFAVGYLQGTKATKHKMAKAAQ